MPPFVLPEELLERRDRCRGERLYALPLPAAALEAFVSLDANFFFLATPLLSLHTSLSNSSSRWTDSSRCSLFEPGLDTFSGTDVTFTHEPVLPPLWCLVAACLAATGRVSGGERNKYRESRERQRRGGRSLLLLRFSSVRQRDDQLNFSRDKTLTLSEN